MTASVLLVDDDRPFCESLAEGLTRRGFDAAWCGSGPEALALLESRDFDVVLTDLSMHGMTGLELCGRVAAARPDVPVVVLTAFGSLESAVGAIRAGAYDFISKPVDVDSLSLTLERARQHRALREELRRLRRIAGESRAFEELLGASPAMNVVYDLIERVADAEVSVVVTGESGTGKELVAHALHRRSRRRGGPFVAVNCSAIPTSLIESQLFGHVRGAFTDAREDRPGLFVQANRGSLFLDEIADLPLQVQPKLLRALQERCVRPVGGAVEVPFDARVIAATNHDIELAVDEHRFRQDLYYRLNVVHLEVPPLRARSGDVLLLAQHFLEKAAGRAERRVVGFTAGAAERLLAYAWPGNVRELQNCVERAVALARYDQVTVDDLPEKIRSYRSPHVVVAGDDPSDLPPLEEVERRYIHRVLESAGGNRTRAAGILGLGRKTLYRRLLHYAEPSPTEPRAADEACRSSVPPAGGSAADPDGRGGDNTPRGSS
ncbi:MAG: sigma-54-dependent Fis family transcriptional regulator [Deltaproteobacteria bacterium]|nr:sigma-54-dependent Fis family transcriptional regulator [Deltaproteobacteria bacterium]